ncbi:MAG: hypothetical protein V1822_04320 [Candidatus Micrarchaeota archaeon]
MDRRNIVGAISVIFSVTMGLLVILGALVMMYGNFDLGLILFVLGLVLVISNEGILPRITKAGPKENGKATVEGLIEEVMNLAAIGYVPPIILAAYLYLSGAEDLKLIIFMGLSFVVVTMKIFAKVAASKLTYRPIEGEEIYAYNPDEADEKDEPGV